MYITEDIMTRETAEGPANKLIRRQRGVAVIGSDVVAKHFIKTRTKWRLGTIRLH